MTAAADWYCPECRRVLARTVGEFSHHSEELCPRKLPISEMLRVGLDTVFLNCQRHEIAYLRGRVKHLQARLEQRVDS